MVECETARRLGGRLSAQQLRALRDLAPAEAAADADAVGDAAAAVRLPGELHRALALRCAAA